MIDFHSHILPGVDDGSKDLEMTRQMLEQMNQQGIQAVVATPHFYAGHDRPEVFLEQRDRAEEALRTAMEADPNLPRLHIGAEVYYFRGLSNSDFLKKLAIRGTQFIMIEMPDAPWPETAWQDLEDIYNRLGMVPIIAHIDRYVAPFRSRGIPARLAQLPVLVQANAEFFLERSTSRMAMRMLKKSAIPDSSTPNLISFPKGAGKIPIT